MDLYQRNLNRLRAANAELAGRLDMHRIENIAVTAARNGMLTVKTTGPDREMFIHSSYDPGREAGQWAEKNMAGPGDVLFVFGFGLGYHVERLLARCPDDVRVVVVEPNLSFVRAAMENIDLGYILERYGTYLIAGEDHTDFDTFMLNCIGFDKLERIHIAEYSPVTRLAAEFFAGMKERITGSVSNLIMDMNTLLRFSDEWVDNLFDNIPEIISSPGIGQLYGEFRGKPAIIVAAGPSLNKNIHLLKQAKGRSVIICVGTALKPMLKAGIKPDLVFSIDGGAGNMLHFKEISGEGIPLVFDICIYPEIPGTYKGPKVVGGYHEDILRWVEGLVSEEKGYYAMGPSVANVAFDLARRFKCNPIILVGQDLAYTDGMSHAGGTIFDAFTVDDFIYKGIIEVEGIDGKPVKTDRVMYWFIRWYETAINATKAEYRVIDATEGGARIPGTEVMTLAGAIREYCNDEVKAAEMIAEVINSYAAPDRQRVGEIAGRLKELGARLAGLAETGKRGVKFSEKLLGLYQNGLPAAGRLGRILGELDAVDRQIENNKEITDIFYLLFQKPLMRFKESGPPAAEESERENGIRVARDSIELYEGIAGAAGKAREMVRKAAAGLKKCEDEGV
jgi:hypothetical protein